VSNIEFIPFENEHAEFILDQGLNSKLLELKPEHRKYAYYLKEIGMSFTGMLNNKPIAAGGVFPLWDGVAEGWVLATEEINKYPITFSKVIKLRCDMLLKNNSIKRFQTSVKADCDVAIRFAKFLGLKEEGLMKNYGPDGADFYRFARIL
tara:strand:- start:318 stop:767 length:450 start_codon:yes stop_codon:yes gene_type:complete